jgi:hypothetical protein
MRHPAGCRQPGAGGAAASRRQKPRNSSAAGPTASVAKMK